MKLSMELDEERSAAAVAANNAMAMITRLRAEKASVQMEALQYQRMMEEHVEYDKEAIKILNDLLAKRDERITEWRSQSLSSSSDEKSRDQDHEFESPLVKNDVDDDQF
ncbi:hypothetical protein LXL04_014671 [Taraxacum kok-saghyz]